MPGIAAPSPPADPTSSVSATPTTPPSSPPPASPTPVPETIPTAPSPPSSHTSPAAIEHMTRRRLPSPSRARKTQIRNRRLRYLQLHPSYYTSPDRELSDPLLYDRLIRQYLTPAEREAHGRAVGWSGVLEADLTRAEAKFAAIQDADADTESRAENERGESVTTREEGEDLWRRRITERFLEGRDPDAEYEVIDEDEGLDDVVEREREEEERWFDAETPEAVEPSTDTGVLDY